MPERAHLLDRLKSDSDAADKEPFQWKICSTSIHRSPCLGVCFAVPWFLLCALLSELIYGEWTLRITWFCSLTRRLLFQADDNRESRFWKLAGTAVSLYLHLGNHADYKHFSMTIPPNAVACLSIWLIIWVSSRVDKRAPFILGSAVVAIIGECLVGSKFTHAH